MIRERCAEYQEQIGLVHHPRRNRRPRAAQYPAGERMTVGDLALGLEGGEDRGVQPLGQRGDGCHVEFRTGAHHDHWARGRFDEAQRRVECRRRWAHPQIRHAALRSGGRFVGRREHLNLVGEHEMADTALQDGVLERHRHQFGVVGARSHHRRIHGHVGEGRQQIDVLEGALTGHR